MSWIGVKAVWVNISKRYTTTHEKNSFCTHFMILLLQFCAIQKSQTYIDRKHNTPLHSFSYNHWMIYFCHSLLSVAQEKSTEIWRKWRRKKERAPLMNINKSYRWQHVSYRKWISYWFYNNTRRMVWGGWRWIFSFYYYSDICLCGFQ